MSAKTDKLELAVAKWINQTSDDITAGRPKSSTSYSDVHLTKNGKSLWLEVKSDHSDNLVNPRVFYDKQWQTNYPSFSALETVNVLNISRETKQFIKSLSEFAEIPIEQLKIPTNKGQFKGEFGVVTIDTLKEYFEVAAPNRYIANVVCYPIGVLVTKDYAERNIHYMQAADDFYMVGEDNPFDLPSDIPVLEGFGDLKVRISTRSEYSEIQAEVKLPMMSHSQYSCMPNTNKINPFNPGKPWYY